MMMSTLRFHLRRLLKNIGTRSNDLKLYKPSKRSNFGSRNPGGGRSVWPSGISVVPRRPGSRPSLTQLDRRLLWRGRPADVTAAQRRSPVTALSLRRGRGPGSDRSFRRRRGWWPAANNNHPAPRHLHRGGAAVRRKAHAAGYDHVGRPTLYRNRR